jgi:hypothetical protein
MSYLTKKSCGKMKYDENRLINFTPQKTNNNKVFPEAEQKREQ